MSLSVFLGVGVDPTQRDPSAGRLRTAVLGEDWPTVRAILSNTADADLASFYTSVACDAADMSWLARIVRSEARDPVAQLLYGARAVDWAWEARGEGLAKQVSAKRWNTFFERLVVAENALFRAVDTEALSATAWWQLIMTGYSRQVGVDETRARFDRANKACPNHLRAHQAMLQQLCEKWGGSHEAMHEFAREAMLTAPPGSPLGSLVAMAHIEHWYRGFARSTFGTTRYFKSRQVRADLHEAADRSVRHPDYVLRPGWLRVHNDFAMAFSLAGEHKAAAAQFRIIKGRTTSIPWDYATLSGPWFFRARRLRAYVLPI